MDNKARQKTGIFTSAIAVLAVSVYIGFNLAGEDAVAETSEIMVYKSSTCGCCNKWVKHLESEGFSVKTKDVGYLNLIKQQHGVQRRFQSCHTAKIGKYFIEGHVPAKDIKKLLKEKPDIKGLAVPGMPMGSPGMEGHRKDNYNVLAVDEKDSATVYSSY